MSMVLIDMSAAEKKMLALALFSLSTQIGPDSFEIIGHMTIKLHVEEEFKKLMDGFKAKQDGNEN